MNVSFIPTITQDGSIGLFNPDVDDIYHSSYGAYSEALEKFISPSGIKEFVKNNSSIRILDICYGMGYNTKAAIKTCLEINPECSISIDCLEIDPDVFVFSFLSKQQKFDFNVLDYLDPAFLDNKQILDSIYKILEDNEFKSFLDPEISQIFNSNKKDIYNSVSEVKKGTCLHNIYYRYISNRNVKKGETSPKHSKISLVARLDDARNVVTQMTSNYDFIFLDAFTPSKLPTLWTVEFFLKLKKLLNPNGNITTYSNSAAVRNGMIEAGLFIGKTYQGTIAHLDEKLIKDFLDEKSLGLLDTRAGIPFYDNNLNSSKEEILDHRKRMVAESLKQSSSAFLKNYTKNKLSL